METAKFESESNNGFFRIFSHGKVERVNPIEYYKFYRLKTVAISLLDTASLIDPILALLQSPAFYFRNAANLIGDFFEKYEAMEIKDVFKKLLISTNKRDQIRLLKGVTFSIDEIIALSFKAYTDFGYLYSRYFFEVVPNGFEGRILPHFYGIKDDGTIDKNGPTDLSDGELRHIIENRKVVVSQFLEKDDVWHCFFITYRSIAGKENWKNGQTHYHYISSAFNVTKDDFIESMRSGKYLSTPVHIDLLDYGHQATV